MISKKTVGIVLLIAGIIVLVLSLLANTLGLGCNLDSFGIVQITGTVVGAIVCIIGLYFMLKK